MGNSRGGNLDISCHPLHNWRLMQYLRYFINRLMGREAIIEFAFEGCVFRLAVTAPREIRRAMEVSHEGALIGRIRSSLREGDIIYDIGANIGLISLLTALHSSGSEARIRCFEPEPRNFGDLNRNIEINGLAPRVLAHKLAMGARDGEVDLFIRGEAGEGRHSIATDRGSSDSIKVPIATAAGFAESHKESPDVVKIDVEGAEGEVLCGMEGLIRAGRPRELFMEVHSKGAGDRMPDGAAIHDWLAGFGYKLAWKNQRRSGEHRHYRAPGID